MPDIKPITSNSFATATGVAASHSSAIPSDDHEVMADHAQSDDDYNDLPPTVDPNLSGTTETSQMHSYLAGAMQGWSENDDYREFLETGDWPSSRLIPEYCQKDQDYDDNGGIPLAIGHPRGHMRSLPVTNPGETDSAEHWNLGLTPRRI